MSAPCRHLPWDTEFFGFPVARVEAPTIGAVDVPGIDGWCGEEGVRCLYLSVPADDRAAVRAAEAGGFRLVDVRLDFERKTAAGAEGAPDPEIAFRAGTEADAGPLGEIAGGSFGASRYYFDEGFTEAQGRALFTTWIVNSLKGYADAVVVAVLGEAPAGFVTLHREEAAARIGLLGVGEAARGRGLGGALIDRAAGWAREAGYARLRVATQARNVAAQRLYQRGGFVTAEVRVFYHKWYEVADGR